MIANRRILVPELWTGMAAVALLSSIGGARAAQVQEHPRFLHLVDLDADGRLDCLRVTSAGALEVALNRGGGHFDLVPQALPQALPSHVLSGDLDGDGSIDLFLLTAGGSLALLGDGTGEDHGLTQPLVTAQPGDAADRRLPEEPASSVPLPCL